MWGMAEIISFINTNNEQAANITPTQTTDWDATVNALSTLVIEHSCSEEIWTAVAETMTPSGLSPEEIEAAIAGTLSVLDATASAYVTPTPK
jgi:gamma-glutamyl phosphate reductase